MNGAHAHLIVNHVSVFGTTFGLMAFVWAWLRGARDLRLFAIALFALSGIFSWVSAETGDAAEKIVESLPGILKESIHTHEQAAGYANINTIVLAALGLVCVAVDRYKPRFSKIANLLILVAGLMAATSNLRTAYLGGLIRHTEVLEKSPPSPN